MFEVIVQSEDTIFILKKKRSASLQNLETVYLT